MQNTKKRDWDNEAKTWDSSPMRIQLAYDVTMAILENVTLNSEMDAMDYGCGTGLVSLLLQPHVRSVTASDSSPGMLAVLENKLSEKGIRNVTTMLLDLEKGNVTDRRFHIIVSSMTMHHIGKLERTLGYFYQMLHPGGYLCIADLDKEEGDFHKDRTGVEHFGFDREEMRNYFQSGGFNDIRIATASTVTRETEGKGQKSFPVFLVAGEKPNPHI